MSTTIQLQEVVGAPYCIASDDGDLVRERLKQALDAGERVQFSFAGVEDLTSAFMNAAVGQLLEAYPEERVRGGIAPIEANSYQSGLFERVIERAVRFYSDPERQQRERRLAQSWLINADGPDD